MRPQFTIAACALCGAPFRLPRWRAADPRRGKFCSRLCAEAARTRRPLAERFWQHVEKTPTCWIWTGYHSPKGYGSIRSDSGHRPLLAHRVAWELEHGPIPAGMSVLHNCPDVDNPACVRVSHLWLGTIADNNADMAKKARSQQGSRHYKAVLTESLVVTLRQRFHSGQASIRSLSREFGINEGTIRSAVKRKSWRHIQP